MAIASRSFVELTGTARLDKRTKDLVKRLSPGDIAIVDHADLDRVSAEELIEAGVPVVVNVAASQTGRFPNPGPLQLVRAGVRLIDIPRPELFDQVAEGERLTVRGSSLFRDGTCLGTGRLLEGGVDSPPLKPRFRARHALVVARGPGFKRDLAIGNPYIRQYQPVLI